MDGFSVRISKGAYSDLKSIRSYYEETLRSPSMAKKALSEIRSVVDSLSELPSRFPVVDSRRWSGRDVRKALAGRFLVYYLVDGESHMVTVLAVLHSRMDQQERLSQHGAE